jgi:CheY-like chemotaxis protein
MLDKPLSKEAARASQSRRMEIVGELSGGIVHDFNNILTVITGTIEVLAEAVADRPDLTVIAKLIEEAAARGASLTSHLMAFARGQPSRHRDVDVNALLVEAARLLRPTLGEQIEIFSMLATDLPAIRVDPSQLMTVLLNLAIIARDAMPDGGKLTFESRCTADGEDCIAGDFCAADYVAIAVKVSGPAISLNRLDQAFARPGWAADFVKQANGHLRLCREEGRETSVELYLPKLKAPARTTTEGPDNAGIEGGDEAVLIVEDDVLVRKYVVSQVQSLGYRTVAAGNASEALAIIAEGGKIDLLLTDVMMPGSFNGWQLAVEALSRRPTLKILYTSGYSESALVHDGYLDAGVLLLAKPYRKADLAKMIRIALAA